MHVLITGANRGIGAALARCYVARGDAVSAASRDANSGLRLDVTSKSDQVALASNLQGRAIDMLVCNAGVFLDKGHSLGNGFDEDICCLLYTSPSPRDLSTSRMPSSA